jgi:hypothetical protein
VQLEPVHSAIGFGVARSPRLRIVLPRDNVGLREFAGLWAVHLARVLLAASQEWEETDITAWRVYKHQSDNTYNVTVTSARTVRKML